MDKSLDVIDKGYRVLVCPQINDKTIFAYPAQEEQEVITLWGDVLTAEKGDYIICAEKNGKPDETDRWVVDRRVFDRTYEEIKES